MIPALQFDNFASDAVEVRRAVIDGGFKKEIGPDGAEYTGISLYPVPHWHERIAQLIRCSIVPRLSGFRLNLAGEFPHSWVHSDDICASYASVLYMNPPEQCQGGTAFWKHAGLGLDHLPSKPELAKQGLYADSFYKLIEREWKVKEAWTQYGMAEMKWNKFITYRTNLFHSRWPFEAFGSGPEDGRLVWVCFYDRA